MRFDLDGRSPYDLIMSGFGLFLIAISALSLLAGLGYILSSESAQGRVVAYEISKVGGTRNETPPRAPVIEFTTREGTTARITGTFFESNPTYAIDETVQIRYWPGAPETGSIDVFSEKWSFPLAFAIFGMMFMLAARAFRTGTA